ncbi:MAG TPA: heavy metal translocating P-type ATPase [Terracidiphilus sp.]|jgi:Cu+-exporting ATPase|nr:heavy metal translocating P-type ATPase [Terracidiphilus sp.]
MMTSASTETTETLTLPVIGMTCAACQHHVETALRSAAGVESARVDLMAHRATVVFDPGVTAPDRLVEAIRSTGYDAVLPRAGEPAIESVPDETAPMAAKAVITILAGIAAMIFAMPLSQSPGMLDRMAMHWLPDSFIMPPDVLRWTLLILTAFLMAWAGRGIYANAARALRHGATNMNTLVSIGTGAAFGYSVYATVFPAPGRDVYFDAVLLILGFLLLGKTLEARARRRALAALDSLSRLRPSTARRVADGVETVVPLSEIHPGDHVLVLPGERFPVDAEIVEGRTTVDESMLTGESTPLARESGQRVLAGALNYDGAVTCRAQSLGEDTVISQITHMVEQAQSSRAPMERLADRASAIFVPTVLGLAVATFGTWLYTTNSVQLAIASSVAVLVIACPCAMGLAVPAALTVAVGRGAQLGVLFKGGEALERLAGVDIVVLDKTGTLTVGRPTLAGIQARSGFTEGDVLRMAAAVEERSNHPIAHAIVDYARARSISWEPALDVKILPGRGVTARIEDYNCILGNEELYRELFGRPPDTFTPPKPGSTRVYMSLDNQPVAAFDARDTLREDAAAAVAALRDAGLRILMLTGDSATAAVPISNQVGIDEVESGLDPAAKLARIRALQQEGHRVAMVGDGINDAGALAQADAGIALGTGADLAQEAGDVLLIHAQPASIPAAVNLARSAVHVMRENLIWAVAYNMLGIPLAAGLLYPAFHVLLSPWLAAAAMALSSVSVLANSLRLRAWHPAKPAIARPR